MLVVIWVIVSLVLGLFCFADSIAFRFVAL